MFVLAGCGGGGGGGGGGTPPPMAPIDLVYLEPVAIYGPDLPITTNIATAGGGVPDLFTATPSLPTGLNLDPASGAISGTPTVLQDATDYVISASNSAGSVDATISIQISPLFVLDGGAPTVTYDPADGIADFVVGLTLEEIPSGSPLGFREISGWSYGLEFDPTQLVLNSTSLGSDAQALGGGSGPDFINISLFANGLTYGVVVDFLGSETLIADPLKQILDVQMSAEPVFLLGNLGGASSALNYTGSLGSPPVVVAIVHSGALDDTPIQNSITVTFQP